MHSILIKNGQIVTAEKSFLGDILIHDDKITAVGPSLEADSAHPKIIDATGLLVLPGGIDPHVHFELPVSEGIVSSDDFYTGTRAALAGGSTTIIDFVTPEPGQLLSNALAARQNAAAKSVCDYSLHMSVTEWRESIGDELKACAEQGLTSVKIYMAYKETIGLDDEDIFSVMQAAARLDMLVLVHCERGDEITKNQKFLLEAGKTAPLSHAVSRSSYVEEKAIQRAIQLADQADCKLYIVHISTREGVASLKKAKEHKHKVFGETCPHYLLLYDREYDRPLWNAVAYVMSPPLRSKADPPALWNALALNTLDTVATDHCPFTLAQKQIGMNNFTKIPNGVAGVEHRLQLLFEHGVNSGKISIEQFVNLTSTRPAQIFGLYPRKGLIAPGSDADIVLWDAKTEDTISASTHVQNCDHTIYEGWKVTGKARTVVSGGRILVDDGDMMGERGDGKFLKRD